MKLNIFIESAAPQKRGKTNEQYFIEQYVEHLDSGAQIKCVGLGGKDKLINFANLIEQNTKKGEKNLVIFDCDSPGNNGGISQRKAWIEKLKKDNNLEFDYFFFPNNKDDGAFEDLLLHIINTEHKCIIDCFECFEHCISTHNSAQMYEMPNMKAKMYTYMETFKLSRDEREKFKKGDWFFNDKRFWDLDNPYLNPLKEFILKNLNS